MGVLQQSDVGGLGACSPIRYLRLHFRMGIPPPPPPPPTLHVNENMWMCVVHCILIFSLDYLKQIAGPRTVPVELGSRYTDKNWTQKLMTLSEFITNHISNKVSTVVHM